MEIGTFMTWFVGQVIIIFSYVYTTLNSITFGGTSLLKIIVFINVIIPFLYVVLTVTKTGERSIEKNDRKSKRH